MALVDLHLHSRASTLTTFSFATRLIVWPSPNQKGESQNRNKKAGDNFHPNYLAEAASGFIPFLPFLPPPPPLPPLRSPDRSPLGS